LDDKIWIADDPHGYWFWEQQELHFQPQGRKWHCTVVLNIAKPFVLKNKNKTRKITDSNDERQYNK